MNAALDYSPDWRALGLVVSLHLAAFFALAHLPDNLPAQARVMELQSSLMVSLVAAPARPPAPPPLNQQPMQPRLIIQPLPPPVLAAPTESAAAAEEVAPPPTEPLPVETLPAETLLPAPVALQISTAPAAESVPASMPVTLPRFDADYLDNPAPAYPALSRRLAEQGLVLLRVYVEPDGRASRVELKQSSGYGRLDSAAQSAVGHWRFVPARKGAVSLGAWVVVPVSFNLRS